MTDQPDTTPVAYWLGHDDAMIGCAERVFRYPAGSVDHLTYKTGYRIGLAQHRAKYANFHERPRAVANLDDEQRSRLKSILALARGKVRESDLQIKFAEDDLRAQGMMQPGPPPPPPPEGWGTW